MTKQSNAMLQLVTESMMRIIVAILLIFGSVQWFSNSSYTLSTTQVYAATNCATATVPQTQCEALVAIFTGMGGSGRNAVYTQGTGNTGLGGPSSGWLANDDPCSWHGVTCDTSSPRKNVIGIQFEGFNIPENQSYCNRSENFKAGLIGSFPSSFSNLNQLKLLNIGHNTGINQSSLQTLTLPSTLTHYCFNNIGATSLQINQFQGLTSLDTLYFDNNSIQTISSNQFQGLTNLRFLSFGYNNIQGLSSSQFTTLSNLQQLYFNNNAGFTGAVPSLYSGLNFTTNTGNVKYLYIQNYGGNPNTICGQKPTWIQTARDQYFSGNRGYTDLDDLSWFGGTGQTINLCLSGASCNTTADCASGTCSSNGNPSGMYTCQGTGNHVPTIAITAPTSGQTYTTPALILIQATGSDVGGSITSVTFRSNNQFIGTGVLLSGSYSYSRTNNSTGTYSLTAIATDNSGATTTSNAVSVTVLASGTTTSYTLTGTLGITGASASVNVCGSSVTANGSGVFSRSMIASGTNCSGITATKTGYTCIINTQGPNPLTGNVSNVVGSCTLLTGNQAPTIAITAPTSGQTYTTPALILIQATGSDVGGSITSVTFRSNNQFIGTGVLLSGSYSYSRTNNTTGTYSLTAIATDNSGATTTSNAVSVTVLASGTTTYTLTGTLGITGASASVNVCGSGVTANGSGVFSRSMIASGTNCSDITATKTGYTCTITSQGPNPLTGNVSNVVGSCSITIDTDNDGIPDSIEGTGDVDNDGIPNNQDTDSDNDSVSDMTEHTAPNNGDGNMDGTQDRLQRTITTQNTPTAGVKTTIQITPVNNCTGTLITENRTEGQVGNDSSYSYPFGLNRIDVSCSSATIRVYYHNAGSLSNYQYRKYRNNNYSQFPISLGTLSGVNFVEFAIVDGGNGDSDNTVNGIIRDPGGLGLYQSSGGGGGGGGGGGRSSTVNCGNGRIDSGEQCDDGNVRGGDGCNVRCTKESGTITGGTTEPGIPSIPKATMIKMLQETLDTLEMACEHESDDRTKKVKNMRDITREDRFDPEATLTNYCITKGYKNKWQKQAAMGIGEAIKIVTKIATLDEGIRFREGEKPDRSLPYKDIKNNAWYATYVNVAYDKGILDGLTDAHRNEKELKAFTPISAQQLLLLLENAGGKQQSTISDEDQALDDILGLILPTKPNLSPMKGKTISRAQAAQYIVNAFPHYFANFEYLVGNNGVYLGNILAGIRNKTEAEQRSYIVDKINTLKNVNEATYGEKYKIDTEVVIAFLEKVID